MVGKPQIGKVVNKTNLIKYDVVRSVKFSNFVYVLYVIKQNNLVIFAVQTTDAQGLK